MKPLLITTAIVLIATGCATQQQGPIVDMQGVDIHEYNLALHECRQYADQAMGAGQGAASGAVAGAIIGALLGAALGDSSLAASTAGAGAVMGGAGGMAQGHQNRHGIMSECLRGRGYKVLN